jgi:putative ABC transport system permease protein
MTLWSRLRSWFSANLRRSRVESEMDAELQFHVQAFAEDLLRSGVPREEALRRARIEFGGIEQTKEECRDARGTNFVESLVQDVRFGLRMLRKNPGFTFAAVLILALGIGANSAVFSIVNSVVLRPLPYANSERLVSVNSNTKMFPDMSLNLAWPAFERVRKDVSSFEQSAVYWAQAKVLTGWGEPQLLEIAAVSNEFFEQLGVRPRQGRLLESSDREEKSGKVVVLSEELWRSRFGADSRIIGRTLTLDRQGYTVVGVAKEFGFPEKTEAWTPLEVERTTSGDPTFYAFAFVGKLKPGIDMNRLNAELRVVSAHLEKEYPKLRDGFELVATKLLDHEVGDTRLAFYVLLGAAALVLLIACTNLASMLLARGWVRQREMAVRAALGASRARIFRQILVETCLLGVLGGVSGAAVAALGVKLFRTVAPEDTPRLTAIHPDWVMVVFALVSALLTGILFGLAPAMHAMRTAFCNTLKEGSGASGVGVGAARARMSRVLVVGEIALAFVLLLGAGLMLQTLQHLLAQDTGFPTDNLLTLNLYRPGLQSEEDREKNVAAQVEQTKNILQQLQRLPGVREVAAANYGLLDGNVFVHGGLKVQGSTIADPNERFAVAGRYVSPTYFKTLGLAILRGREFGEQDTLDTSPVAIVNERMAQKYWGTLDVLGKRFSGSKNEKGGDVWSEIVGVVTDAREFQVRDEPAAEYFLPLYQGDSKGSNLLVRTIGNPETIVGVVARRIWSTYPDLPVSHVATIKTTIEESVGNERLHAAFLGVFAGTGLLMALAGTYGMIAYAVERRTQEIGLRIALGARRKDVLLLVAKYGFLPVLAGIGIGIPVAVVAQKAIGSELYGVKAQEPLTFAVAALLMVLVAGVACYIPARRAILVDPMVALRYE